MDNALKCDIVSEIGSQIMLLLIKKKRLKVNVKYQTHFKTIHNLIKCHYKGGVFNENRNKSRRKMERDQMRFYIQSFKLVY